MLSEHDRRVLDAVFTIFLEDFDARNAATYMEMLHIFSSDDSRQIEEQKSSLAALRDFYQRFSRKADNLNSIEDYLKHAKQPNLIESLNAYRCFQDSSNDYPLLRRHLTKQERHRILVKGQVPFGRNLISRPYAVERLAQALSAKCEYDNGFFVVLHGMAGAGKTSLATYTLAETDLLGSHFDHVCFLSDGRCSPKDVKAMFYDLMIMLQQDVMNPPPMDISDTALRKLIIDAMIDYPNLLVIIDDVTNVETVDWAERLHLRVLATTRDKTIFNTDSNSCMDFITVDGLRPEETKELMARNGIQLKDGVLRAARAVALAHEVSSGNPALLLKMANMAEKCPSTLYKVANNISKCGVSSVEVVSSYRFKNLHATLSDSVMRLSEWDKNALASIAVMPADQWIPLDVWELIIPVDVSDTGDIQFEVRKQMRALHKNGCWVVESADHDAFKVPAIIINYLKETVDQDTLQELFSRLEIAFNTAQAANGHIDERQNAIRSFFASNSYLFARSPLEKKETAI